MHLQPRNNHTNRHGVYNRQKQSKSVHSLFLGRKSPGPEIWWGEISNPRIPFSGSFYFSGMMASPKNRMSRKMEYGKVKQRRGDFSINMCSIRSIIWGRYHEVRIHPTQEFRVQGLSPYYNIRPTMKWRSWTKTRSIDAKANEKKDSETNLRASVTHSNRKRNEVGSSTTSEAKEVGVTFLRSWEMWMLLSRINRSQWVPQTLSEMAMMTHGWHLLRLMLSGWF